MRRHARVQRLGEGGMVGVEGVAVDPRQVVDDVDPRPLPHMVQEGLLQGEFGRGVERRLRRVNVTQNIAEL